MALKSLKLDSGGNTLTPTIERDQEFGGAHITHLPASPKKLQSFFWCGGLLTLPQ